MWVPPNLSLKAVTPRQGWFFGPSLSLPFCGAIPRKSNSLQPMDFASFIACHWRAYGAITLRYSFEEAP